MFFGPGNRRLDTRLRTETSGFDVRISVCKRSSNLGLCVGRSRGNSTPWIATIVIRMNYFLSVLKAKKEKSGKNSAEDGGNRQKKIITGVKTV